MSKLSSNARKRAHTPADMTTNEGRRRAWREMLWNDHGFLRIRFRNLHPVSEDLWRANQPQPHHLRDYKKELGLKTLVNLRGPSSKGYYLLEREACEENNIDLVDFKVYSRDVPTPDTIVAAKALFDDISYPAMIHCKSGADRTGIMAALYLMLRCDCSVENAAEQLSLRYLHIKQGKAGILDYYLNAYVQARAASGISFFDWATDAENVSGLKAAFLARR